MVTRREDLLTRTEAAKYLGMSKRWLVCKAHDTDGPLITRLGTRVYYLRSDLDAFIEQNRRVTEVRCGARKTVEDVQSLQGSDSDSKKMVASGTHVPSTPTVSNGTSPLESLKVTPTPYGAPSTSYRPGALPPVRREPLKPVYRRNTPER